VVTVDKYLCRSRSLCSPSADSPRASTPYLFLVQAAPFAETVSIDRWLQPLSEPVRREDRTRA
jgi:hypothetical protein